MIDSTQDDEKVQSFCVRKSGYYRDKWKKFDEKPGSITSFNLAACVGQLVWLAYRKLYMPLLWAAVVSIACASLRSCVEHEQFISGNLVAAWDLFAVFLYLAVFGLLGNYWYWRKFRQVAQQAALRESDRDAQLRFIQSKGGTSTVAAWVVLVLLLMPASYWGVYQASRIDDSAFVLQATGPLTLAEVEANFLAFMDEPLAGERKQCVFREVTERARVAGDPEALDPAAVELLPADGWDQLDPSGKRLILAQAIGTKAFFVCKWPSPGASATENLADKLPAKPPESLRNRGLRSNHRFHRHPEFHWTTLCVCGPRN